MDSIKNISRSQCQIALLKIFFSFFYSLSFWSTRMLVLVLVISLECWHLDMVMMLLLLKWLVIDYQELKILTSKLNFSGNGWYLLRALFTIQSSILYESGPTTWNIQGEAAFWEKNVKCLTISLEAALEIF